MQATRRIRIWNIGIITAIVMFTSALLLCTDCNTQCFALTGFAIVGAPIILYSCWKSAPERSQTRMSVEYLSILFVVAMFTGGVFWITQGGLSSIINHIIETSYREAAKANNKNIDENNLKNH